MDKIVNLAPFKIQVHSGINIVNANLSALYPQHVFETPAPSVLPDYFVSIDYSGILRKFIRKQCVFSHDGYEPFKGLPEHHAYASLEWGINYLIATNAFQYVIVHSGIVAYKDSAVLFPAPPGSGKSTLTAYLQGCENWRLFSDEMALLKPYSNLAIPFVRPICLKNRSGTLVREWYPEAAMSSVARDTHKGDVIHLSPSTSSWEHSSVPAPVKALVFPQFKAGATTQVTLLTQAEAFMQLAQNAFNFNILGEAGFTTLAGLIETIPAYEIEYSDVESVRSFLEQEVLIDF